MRSLRGARQRARLYTSTIFLSNDGGPGAEYADCADCGPRFPPPPPMCAETCSWASDADCDDGGPGSGSARPGPTACGKVVGPDHRIINHVVTKVTVVCIRYMTESTKNCSA